MLITKFITTEIKQQSYRKNETSIGQGAIELNRLPIIPYSKNGKNGDFVIASFAEINFENTNFTKFKPIWYCSNKSSLQKISIIRFRTKNLKKDTHFLFYNLKS